jgi:L-rhamnose 1-dehydrogenase
MQSTAVALGKYNIRANAILPGTIQTAINEEDLSNDEKRAAMEQRTCLGRLGSMFLALTNIWHIHLPIF